MLVISRKVSESIVIGDNIEILVSEIGTDRVKICINAPKEVPIVRRELLETQNMNKEAATSPNNKLLEQLKTRLK
ncbi:MAG TPA: carbon storage regulator [Oscillospiraceae bacterium]|nr:carbon storage regulator [Oscillospiraceae bacterium]